MFEDEKVGVFIFGIMFGILIGIWLGAFVLAKFV